MQHPGWILVVIGLVLTGIGAIWLMAPSLPWLGRLPGDIAVEGKHFRFYFPIVTCIIWLIQLFSK
jgi:hypothetical protein